MAFEIGNQLAKRHQTVTEAIKRAVTQDNGKRIREGVEIMLDRFAEGDPFAVQYVRDTLQGKPAQAVSIEDGDGNSLMLAAIRMVVVRDVGNVVSDQSNSRDNVEHTDSIEHNGDYTPLDVGNHSGNSAPELVASEWQRTAAGKQNAVPGMVEQAHTPCPPGD